MTSDVAYAIADVKKKIIEDLNFTIGSDIHNLSSAWNLDSELAVRQKVLQKKLVEVGDDAPSKISAAIKKSEKSSKTVESLKKRSEILKQKIDDFLERTQPMIGELDKQFTALGKLEEVLAYLSSYTKVEELCTQMNQCNDDEQLVVLYGEMKSMCEKYKDGHRGNYIKEYTRYWHNILKDNLSKNYEEHLKLLKWPLLTGSNIPSPSKEIMNKFTHLTRQLLMIEEPEDTKNTSVSDDLVQDQINPCLPVKILLRPLKKRFLFHFTGTRQTARVDRPEWFLTQTLTWVKDHRGLVRHHVQPVADKLQLKHVDAVTEFVSGLVTLAAERLHTVLGVYQAQGAKGDAVDVDAAFAHAVDEALGFHRELNALIFTEVNIMLSVLTKAEIFVQWLAIERKYALAKMDDILENEQWMEPLSAGAGSAVGDLVWVPRGADCFVTLLKTIEDRYAALPQPGHRLQFLELQLELIEEWRVRLTQLLSAASSLQADSLLVGGVHPLTAVINAAHRTHSVLLQWAHSLHYLQLHYYRKQFQHFTEQQHGKDKGKSKEIPKELTLSDDECEFHELMSLREIEDRAKRLAILRLNKRESPPPTEPKEKEEIVFQDDLSIFQKKLVIDQMLLLEDDEMDEEQGAFAEAASLLANLRTAGIATLAEHILLEFKATIRDYKYQKWHSMVTVEEAALTVSSPLCRPLAALVTRMTAASQTLAPKLAYQLRATLSNQIDIFLFEELVLECWFNTGGTLQFTHDVTRNIMPAFAPSKKGYCTETLLPKLRNACKLLNLDYEDARRLRALVSRDPKSPGPLRAINVMHLSGSEALRILAQRADLAERSTPYVMELF